MNVGTNAIGLSFGLFLLALPTAANADCRTGRYSFNLQGDAVTATDTITSGSVCTHPSWASGRTTFNAVSIVSRSANGSLVVSGLKAEYKPRTGFKGTDQYTIKVCGDRAGAPGCSTITYNTSVQ
jgi:hypothetical protein